MSVKDTKLIASDVIRAAEWLHRWLPKAGVGRWLVTKMFPSACLSRFEETMRDWELLSRADRADFVYDLRKDEP